MRSGVWVFRLLNEPKDRSCSATTGNDSTVAPRTDGFARSANAPESDPFTHTCSERRSSWPEAGGTAIRPDRTRYPDQQNIDGLTSARSAPSAASILTELLELLELTELLGL